MTQWTGQSGRAWRLRPADPEAVHAVAASCGVMPALARVLVARGYGVDGVRRFLSPSADDLLDPYLLLGMDRAVPRIRQAIVEGQPVRLVTDYDVDGTMSCLILHAALDRLAQRLGEGVPPRISYHVPDRFTEGYGLSARAVERAAEDGVRLLVTADIGVRDHASVRMAAERGIDVLVCDHHLPAGESVPEAAYAVICPPQEGCAYPNKALAACGVSLKLAQALLADDPRGADMLRSLSKLAAIGTVADIVDVSTPENRAILRQGLEALNTAPHAPGLSALLQVACPGDEPITAATVGWRIGPRINAAGRLNDANAIVRLLRERDPASARGQAQAIDLLNRERQDVQAELYARAFAAVPEPAPAFVVVHGREDEGWHRGVVGIVASKLRERVQRPVAVVSRIGGGMAVGSVRSVPAVHAVRALDAAAPLLHRYGGHAAAAGFSLSEADLPRLAEVLADYVTAHHDDGSLMPVEDVDLELERGQATLALIRELERLEPTGKGNERPRVALHGPVRVVRTTDKGHAFLDVAGTAAVWWSAGEKAEGAVTARGAVGTLDIDRWRGAETPRLVVEDLL